jgi:hypothetical protein
MVNVDHFPLESLGPVSVKHESAKAKAKTAKKPAKKKEDKSSEETA